MADISFTKQESDITLTRHYYEPSHGKSAADGLSAIVKHAATIAVTRNQVKIRDAAEFHAFCVQNLKEVGQSVYKSRSEIYKSANREFYLVDPKDTARHMHDSAEVFSSNQ